jgi:hypothetical protein
MKYCQYLYETKIIHSRVWIIECDKRTTCILSAEEDDVNTGGNGADRIDCGKGHDSVRDFQPGQDKIKSYKPTIDRGSLLVKNR